MFVFCIGMLIAYYITAELTNSVYGMTFLWVGRVFDLLTGVCCPDLDEQRKRASWHDHLIWHFACGLDGFNGDI